MLNNVNGLIKDTVREFIYPQAEIISVESKPINMGLQAIELYRHKVLINNLGHEVEISIVSKNANIIERWVYDRLYKQKANVPFCLSGGSENQNRSLICIQDVDYKTDYSKLNFEMLQKKEINALFHIHASNFGLRRELSWLPFVDQVHIEKMIYERWKPQWKTAKENEQFVELFGEYIPLIEDVSNTIVEEIQPVVNDEITHTLIHNDLNPGNVLVHNNTDVFFIDWEEARYGSLFLDIPLRCFTSKQVEEYKELLAAEGKEIPESHFNQLFTIASRYLGLRYMSWNLGAWSNNSNAKDGLKRYLDMVAGTAIT